jgi:hypothetical protein
MKKLKFEVPFRRILVTAKEIKTASNIVLSVDEKSTKGISDIQEVVKLGPLVKDSGLVIEIGDEIMLNVLLPDGRPKPRVGYPVFMNKVTGRPATVSDSEKDCDMYFLIEAQEVMGVIPK